MGAHHGGLIMVGGYRLALFALPLMLLAGLLQPLVALLRRRAWPWRETLATLGIVAGQVVIRPVTRLLVLGTWMLLWPYRLATISLHGPLGWLALFVAVEFMYYWHHRASHGTRWLWATHAVHHTPEHMNFLAALRLGWTEEVSGGFLLFTPLVLVGFAPAAVAGMIVIDLLYQFWIHSESRVRLGWLEYVLNTPSHHRVHHGSNAAYLDRNFGGVLIVFDRLFGTFAAESAQDPPRYGLVHRMHSHNPANIVFHEWSNLIRDVRARATWRGRLAVLFGAP